MIQETLRGDENVIIQITNHLDWCALLLNPLAPLDAVMCSCDAERSRYGRTILHRKNLVTNAGDTFYAQHIAKSIGATVPTITNAFTTCELANDAASNPAPAKGNNRGSMVSIIASSQQAVASGYPRVDDPDPDNTGAGSDVASWQFNWSAASFNATNISDGWITVTGAAASEPILNHFDEGTSGAGFAAVFDKTSSDTLKMIVNHTLLGT